MSRSAVVRRTRQNWQLPFDAGLASRTEPESFVNVREMKMVSLQYVQSSLRAFALATTIGTALTLTACGGGGGDGSVQLQVGVFVDGRQSGDYVYSGTIQTVTMAAGQSIELDANEPVVWTLQVGSTYYEGFDTSVYYQGVTITETTLSPSRIALDTSTAFFLPYPVTVTFTAVSTYDSAVVATIDVVITN
jgi:hypothetical protein